MKEPGAGVLVGMVLAGLSLPVHELLHVLCYREDMFFYHDLPHGLLFLVGTEDMSRGRFIFMCLCPNLVLGLCPYLFFFFFPQWVGVGAFGLISLGTGLGDYLNAYHAWTQMPRGAKTYLCGLHSYWYL